MEAVSTESGFYITGIDEIDIRYVKNVEQIQSLLWFNITADFPASMFFFSI